MPDRSTPSPALRRLRSQADKARDRYFLYCAHFAGENLAEHPSGYWANHYLAETRRWKISATTLAVLASQQEREEQP